MRARDLPPALVALFRDAPKKTAARTELERAKEQARREKHEAAFALQIRAHKLPPPVRELRFAAGEGRGWRFDFAWEQFRLAAELDCLVAVRMRDGSVFAGGRHATFQGFRRDCEKYNAATRMGWSVLRFEQELIESGNAVQTVEETLKARGWKP